MRIYLRRLSLLFSAGAMGGLVNSLGFWALGRSGMAAVLGVTLAPRLVPMWFYPRIVWGGLWGLLFALPLYRHSPLKRGACLSLVPTAMQLFVLFPFRSFKGYLGLQLGATTPVLTILLNAVWGVAGAYWLGLTGEE